MSSGIRRAAVPRADKTHRGRRVGTLASALALLAAAPGLAAQEASWSLGGSLTEQAFAVALEGEPSASYGSAATLETTLRARGSVLRAEVSAEAALLSGAAAQAFVDAGALPPDTLYATGDTSDPDSVETVLAARMRTAYLKWNADAFSLTLGRQIVNYGKGTAWSPADLFTERDYSGLSVVRRGSDALRLTVPLGSLSLAEAVAAPSSDPAEGVYALRAAGLLFDVLDGSLVGAWNGKSDEWIAGGDAKFDLDWISFHADAAYSIPAGGGEGAARTVLGFDTSFGDCIWVGEYYYNGGGAAADPAFPGAHNAYSALTWNLADYHALALSGLWDLEAALFSAQATWVYDLAQNGTLTAYIKAADGSFSTSAKAWSAQLGLQMVVSF